MRERDGGARKGAGRGTIVRRVQERERVCAKMNTVPGLFPRTRKDVRVGALCGGGDWVGVRETLGTGWVA